MCLDSVNWRSIGLYFRPIAQMDGYKYLVDCGHNMGLHSPIYNSALNGDRLGWQVGLRRRSDGHGFYFCPTLLDLKTFAGGHRTSGFYPVRAYGVFRRGRQNGAVVYMAHEMELRATALPDKMDEIKRQRALAECLEALKAL